MRNRSKDRSIEAKVETKVETKEPRDFGSKFPQEPNSQSKSEPSQSKAKSTPVWTGRQKMQERREKEHLASSKVHKKPEGPLVDQASKKVQDELNAKLQVEQQRKLDQ